MEEHVNMSKTFGKVTLILAGILLVGGFVAERILHLPGMLPIYGILALLICASVAVCIVTYQGRDKK